MSDIVERLRDTAPADHGLASGDMMREAADEIERLYRETATVKEKWLGAMAEIERLNADKAAMTKLAVSYDDDNDRLRAEIERLKAVLRECESSLNELAHYRRTICPECGQPMREGGYCDHVPF